jgi:glycosyltransferase involved in cell wall biosynthesis
MELDELTIVLPTRNEEHNIPEFLSSLPASVSLIVVDASEDSTPDLITALRPYRTLVLRRPGTVTEARQIGADAAYTPWLLFTDADISFSPDYFGQLMKYRDYDALYGPKFSTTHFARYYRWFTYGQQLSHLVGIPAASGSNLLISRRVFKAVGGFDLRLACNEDSELAWHAKRSGYRVLFAPDLVVYARDHRRLHQGMVRKTLHSIIRCSLLYLNLMPTRWRGHDWGYWAHRRGIGKPVNQYSDGSKESRTCDQHI